jgi:hypothetical protein
MKIGIELNGVLRDTIEKFKQTYEKYLIDEEYDEKLKTYESIDNGEDYKEVFPQLETLFKYEVLSEVDSMDLSKHFAFPNNDELYNFMYQEFPMQIFGHAPSAEMTSFNDLNDLYIKLRDEHDLLIVSDEIGKSKPASLFFISKFGCLLEKVKFYSNQTIKYMWDEVDVLLTANPDLLLNHPQNKIVVKYETKYNKHVSSPYTISSIKEFETMLENILKQYA